MILDGGLDMNNNDFKELLEDLRMEQQEQM